MRPDVAYKILSAADWRLLLAEGHYEGSAVDLADGYIHMSTKDQLEQTAAKHYAGLNDLMLVEVALPSLGDTLVWEPSRGGALFPHIYGPLPASACVKATPMAVTQDGRIILS